MTGDESDPIRLRRAFQALVHRFGMFESDRTPCGQPLHVSHAHALMALLDASGLRQRELAARLGLTKSGASRLVDQLVRRGWVERHPDGTDGRACALTLTHCGRRVAEQVNGSSLARFSAMIERLPESARAPVITSLELLCGVIPVTTEPHHPVGAS